MNSSHESIKIKMKEYKASILTLPEELQENIVNIFEEILKYELRDWIPIDNLDWDNLVYNPNAIDLFDMYPDKIDWGVLSGNPEAMNLLEANQDKINWEVLSRNPNAMNLLEANQYKINWDEFSLHPSIFILR